MADGQRDIVTVNSMMEAFCGSQRYRDCIRLFERVHRGEIGVLRPDAITFSIALKASTESTAYRVGHFIAKQIGKDEHIRRHLSVQINLIDFYGKCGMMDCAESVFLDVRKGESDKYRGEIGIWNAMIKAHGRNGQMDAAKRILDAMRRDSELSPDRKTYLILLNGYNHNGMVAEAEYLWSHGIVDMELKYDCFIVTTLVDCFVRRGMLNEARQLIMDYECHQDPYEAMWTSLLNGAKQSKDTRFAEHIYSEMSSRLSVNTIHNIEAN